jgi:hypothetical protein
MDKQKAKSIIEKFGLIPGKSSHSILKAIVDGLDYDERFSPYLDHTQYFFLSSQYQLELNNSNHTEETKFSPFYRMILRKYPQFYWTIFSSGKKSVNFSTPRVNNLRVSLLTLLLSKIPVINESAISSRYPCIAALSNNEVTAWDNFFKSRQFIYPSEEIMEKIISSIKWAQVEQNLACFFPICPDYAAVATGDPTCPFRHTFDGVGEGLGPVAQQLKKTISLWRCFLRQIGVRAKFVAGIADFEGFCSDNLQRLSLTEKEFINRVDKSRLLFEKETGIETYMISDLLGGKDKWLLQKQQISHKIQEGDFGESNITQAILLNLVKKRYLLYKRWYGQKNNLQAYIPIVLAQAIDYVLIGKILLERFENPFVFAADTNVFELFYNYYKPIPRLYMKKNYC